MPADPYRIVALIYDHIMQSLSYTEWGRYISAIKSFHIDEAEKFLEIACGTGKLNSYLEKLFDNITLLDISKNMLEKIEPSKKRVCADMTRLPFKNNFDFIYSTFDSINYVTDEEEIIKYLSEIRNVLSDEGIFTFDASLENNSIKNANRLNRKGKFRGIQYKQSSKFDSTNMLHRNKFSIELGNGEIFEEVHTQKIYDFEFYFEAAESAGLSVIDCYEAFTFEDADRESERIQFLMKKL